jgi:hypothetical protein
MSVGVMCYEDTTVSDFSNADSPLVNSTVMASTQARLAEYT